MVKESKNFINGLVTKFKSLDVKFNFNEKLSAILTKMFYSLYRNKGRITFLTVVSIMALVGYANDMLFEIGLFGISAWFVWTFIGIQKNLSLFGIMGTLVLVFVSMFTNEQTLEKLLSQSGVVSAINNITFIGKNSVVRQYLSVSSLAFAFGLFFELLIAILEWTRKPSVSMSLTFLVMGVLVYSYFGLGMGIGRVFAGVVFVALTLVVSKLAMKKNVTLDFDEMSLLERFKIHRKLLQHKALVDGVTIEKGIIGKLKNLIIGGQVSNGKSDHKINFINFKNTYKIKTTSLKRKLEKMDMFDVRYFKQLPLTKARKPKKEVVS